MRALLRRFAQITRQKEPIKTMGPAAGAFAPLATETAAANGGGTAAPAAPAGATAACPAVTDPAAAGLCTRLRELIAQLEVPAAAWSPALVAGQLRGLATQLEAGAHAAGPGGRPAAAAPPCAPKDGA
jgi:hypothetical protein